jgi:hypothetical protein
LIIEASNKIRDGTDLGTLRQELLELAQKSRQPILGPVVRKEGKSGYYKMRRILDVDLGTRNATISPSVSDQGVFVVIITMNTDGLVV